MNDPWSPSANWDRSREPSNVLGGPISTSPDLKPPSSPTYNPFATSTQPPLASLPTFNPFDPNADNQTNPFEKDKKTLPTFNPFAE
jgi:hypothetical protein